MFEWKTSAIKFISCACCVGAGLPVGPEVRPLSLLSRAPPRLTRPRGAQGPMIFLGATLGGLVSQGTVNFSLLPPSPGRDKAEAALSAVGRVLWPFKRFRNKCDQRDFMTAGCAAGVAGAFGAPIGASRLRSHAPRPHPRSPSRRAAVRHGGGGLLLERDAGVADLLCMHDVCLCARLRRVAVRGREPGLVQQHYHLRGDAHCQDARAGHVRRSLHWGCMRPHRFALHAHQPEVVRAPRRVRMHRTAHGADIPCAAGPSGVRAMLARTSGSALRSRWSTCSSSPLSP